MEGKNRHKIFINYIIYISFINFIKYINFLYFLMVFVLFLKFFSIKKTPYIYILKNWQLINYSNKTNLKQGSKPLTKLTKRGGAVNKHDIGAAAQ